MDIWHGHAAGICGMDMQHEHAAKILRKYMQHGHAEWTGGMDIRHGHIHIYAFMFCIIKCSKNFVSFRFAETKRKMTLSYRNFGETEKVYFGETIVTEACPGVILYYPGVKDTHIRVLQVQPGVIEALPCRVQAPFRW
jgi:hypothetical protein